MPDIALYLNHPAGCVVRILPIVEIEARMASAMARFTDYAVPARTDAMAAALAHALSSWTPDPPQAWREELVDLSLPLVFGALSGKLDAVEQATVNLALADGRLVLPLPTEIVLRDDRGDLS